MAQPTKVCTKCQERKGLKQFHQDRNREDGRTTQCADCRNDKTAKWRADNPGYSREHARRYRVSHPEKVSESQRKHRAKVGNTHYVAWRYGLTKLEYDEYLARPCVICGRDSRVLDHRHSDGRVIAGLCDSCNKALGLFDHDPGRLKVASEYAKLHRDYTRASTG